MVTITDAWRNDYESKFAALKIKPNVLPTALAVARKIAANRSRYEPAAQATGVPWFLIGILHERESSLNFATYLGDGEPLDHPTHNVPKGRGPFKDFTTGAIDALVHEGFDKVTDWSIGAMLFHIEEFNGEGYHNHGMPSPYVFAGSNWYSKGKYDVDGHFNATLVDTQLGGAVMLTALIQLGILVIQQTGVLKMVTDAVIPAAVPAIPAPVPVPAQAARAATAGVNVSRTTTITSIFGAVFGALFAAGSPILAAVDPSTLHVAASAIGTLAGIGMMVSTVWGQLHLTSTANNNTLATINSLTTFAAQTAQILQNASQPAQAAPTAITQ